MLSLPLPLPAEKTEAAWLGGGEPLVSRLDLPGRGPELPVAGEIDFLGIHFLGPERFRARETTVNRIGKVRYVQPRQHAVLGHSELILEQMRRVDRTVRKWLRREFGPALTRRATGRPRSRGLGAWRVRSAARMYEMEAAAHA